MRYPMFLHWSEGQFLQPHHFQQFQRTIVEAMNVHSDLCIPYKEGFCEINLDTDALRARRVVIRSFSAIMPDKTFVSMPGNCDIKPLTLDFNDASGESEFMVYIALPYLTASESNLVTNGISDGRRYQLHESNFMDQNTGDNETTIFHRMLNLKLITDPKKATDCSVLPMVKLRWTALDNKEPVLELCDDYIPPFVVVQNNSSLFFMIRELIFELKSVKSKILTDIESEGFDPSLISGSQLLRVMLLEILNVYINTLGCRLLPDRVSPYELYFHLSNLLASLRSLFPLSDSGDIKAYVHYNIYPVFTDIISSIRSLLNSKGKAECIEIPFVKANDSVLQVAELSPEVLFKARDFYISLKGPVNWKERINDIETGDNFRLIDRESADSRIRGVKLSYVRFPPRYLPIQSSDTVYFKIMTDESQRMWRYILDDHQMLIDSVPTLFSDFEAKLYIAVVGKE